jgi:N-acetylneuraminic acid mutarotase
MATYGSLGVASASNVPGARESSASWTDRSGNLWLFGGDGNDSTGTAGLLNDLWKFDLTTRTWTWVGGSDIASVSGVYGTLGVAAVSNVPGARQNAVTWTDNLGNFWLFGGQGLDKAAESGLLNDLWEFSPSNGNWTWMGGRDVVNTSGIYGKQGVPSNNYVPGARQNAVGVADYSGNLWLFGGAGYDSASGTPGLLNDLWMFSPATSTWVWVSGNNVSGSFGNYGLILTPAPTNMPGARQSASSWTDASGNFWLFGGNGYDSAVVLPTDPPPTIGNLNDLWEYNSKTKVWTWISGNYITATKGTYGTLGTGVTTNTPGARAGAVAWTDSSGNLWLFGGNFFNDLWQFSPGSDEWTWSSGSDAADAPGDYGMQGISNPENVPGGRLNAAHWADGAGNFWVFGGDGYDSTGLVPQVPPVPIYPGILNDLWVYGR